MTQSSNSERAGTAALPSHPFTATSLGVSLTVNELGTSVAWYRDVLGFTVEKEYERAGVVFGTRLRAGDVMILVTQDNGTRGGDRVKGDGCSFQFTTTQNVDELAARAKARGVALDTEPMDAWGARVFRLRDPDGFKLVISSER